MRTWNNHPGKLRLLAFVNNAHMGKYRDALHEMPVNPDITLTRRYRAKYGCGANLEQELTENLGAFARLGWNDGQSETWAFTEIDATLALGLLLKAKQTGRLDRVRLALDRLERLGFRLDSGTRSGVLALAEEA